MAEIHINDLINVIKTHENYHKQWDNGVSPETALYIKFHNNQATDLETIDYTTKDGHELFVDVDKNGVVYGIEII